MDLAEVLLWLRCHREGFRVLSRRPQETGVLSSAPGLSCCTEELCKVRICAELPASEPPWRAGAVAGVPVWGSETEWSVSNPSSVVIDSWEVPSLSAWRATCNCYKWCLPLQVTEVCAWIPWLCEAARVWGISVLETWKRDNQSCFVSFLHQKQMPFFMLQPPLTCSHPSSPCEWLAAGSVQRVTVTVAFYGHLGK